MTIFRFSRETARIKISRFLVHLSHLPSSAALTQQHKRNSNVYVRTIRSTRHILVENPGRLCKGHIRILDYFNYELCLSRKTHERSE